MSINQGSCRGFILLYSNPKIYLWNTSTRVHRQIPSLPPNHSRLPSYGFGYDESTDDYLVVSVSYDYIPSSYDVISHLAIFHFKGKKTFRDFLVYEFLGAVKLIYG
ncbi:galactose oxidase, putative [Medicago truncatula]|uniref:Galactose oxidase, putative n=1 Tax=Medicago truncatula TaxID=3880 RepID=A0A072VUS4_MEDTR|nr:galactose oxidase, putative [Medicago truncatula]